MPPRSSGTGVLNIPRTRTKQGEAAFSVYVSHCGIISPHTSGVQNLVVILNQDEKLFFFP